MEATIGKRSSFERRDRDLYLTPIEPVLMLGAHLPRGFTFCEPCAADGTLVRHIETVFEATCAAAYDIVPGHRRVRELDALSLLPRHLRGAEFIITNPPWRRDLLQNMILRFADLAPTWLLFDADWWHTEQSRPFRSLTRKVVSVGRVKWIEGSSSTGKDNTAWYLFGQPDGNPTELH